MITEDQKTTSAIEAEREACAKVVEEYRDVYCTVSVMEDGTNIHKAGPPNLTVIAAAIRQRTRPYITILSA